MAATPTFVSTPRIGVADVSTLNAARDGSGTMATVLTAATAGTKIERVVIKATGDPADSLVTLFLHDGTTAHIFDEVDLGNPLAPTATSESFRVERAYYDIILPNGWSLRAAITAAPTSGVVKVLVFGGDLT